MSNQANATDVAMVKVRNVLADYFLGFKYEDGRPDTEHLEEATRKVVNEIDFLFSLEPTPTKKLGATVMTHSASMRSGRDGLPGIAPRNV